MSDIEWTDAEREAATDACEHEGLHKACATCAPIIAATVAALAPHVEARVRQAKAEAQQKLTQIQKVIFEDAALNSDHRISRITAILRGDNK